MSSDNICQTVTELGKTLSNPVKTVVAYLAAILFTSPECTSDSWTTIFFLSILHAITTGNATYHHLQKTTSALDFRR
jgi:hypothetical protein